MHRRMLSSLPAYFEHASRPQNMHRLMLSSLRACFEHASRPQSFFESACSSRPACVEHASRLQSCCPACFEHASRLQSCFESASSTQLLRTCDESNFLDSASSPEVLRFSFFAPAVSTQLLRPNFDSASSPHRLRVSFFESACSTQLLRTCVFASVFSSQLTSTQLLSPSLSRKHSERRQKQYSLQLRTKLQASGRHVMHRTTLT